MGMAKRKRTRPCGVVRRVPSTAECLAWGFFFLVLALNVASTVWAHDALTVAEVCELAAAHGNGVPPDLVVAQVWEESGGQPGIVSSAGAVGLLQVVQKYHPDADLRDAATNIDIGTHVLLQDMFYLSHIRAGWETVSDIDWSDSAYLRRGLAGYVMGPGNVTWYDKHSGRDWPADVVRYADVIERVYSEKRCA